MLVRAIPGLRRDPAPAGEPRPPDLLRAGHGGYAQCAPETAPPAIYCESQSAESWPVLARILTSDRVARLHATGFADPGRSPNYWKFYPVGEFSDAAIANELLTILYEVYGYDGTPKLKFLSEKGRG